LAAASARISSGGSSSSSSSRTLSRQLPTLLSAAEPLAGTDAADGLGAQGPAAAPAAEEGGIAAPEGLAEAATGSTLSCSSWKEAAGQSTPAAAWGSSWLQQLSSSTRTSAVQGFACVAELCGESAAVLAEAVWAGFSS
jgi:hypothetical protein